MFHGTSLNVVSVTDRYPAAWAHSADGDDKSAAEATAPVFRQHIDLSFLLEVGGSGFEHLDVREPHGCISRERDPETAVALSRAEDVVRGRLHENGFRRVASQERGS